MTKTILIMDYLGKYLSFMRVLSYSLSSKISNLLVTTIPKFSSLNV